MCQVAYQTLSRFYNELAGLLASVAYADVGSGNSGTSIPEILITSVPGDLAG